MSRACRHCGSPARGNPCWWGFKDPAASIHGGDPPCACDEYAERHERRESAFVRNLLLIGIGIPLAGTLIIYFLS